MNIIGVSALYHDSAAALVTPTFIKAAAEERFTRIKHDSTLPGETLQWLKQYCDSEVDYLVFYERPLLKLDRIQSLRAGHLKNWGAYHKALREWSNHKLWVRPKILNLCKNIGLEVKNEILFADHHQSHAASAFYPSPFEEAAVLCLDGVGEWATGSISVGKGDTLQLLQQQLFPHSMGLFYAAMTSIAGFKVNSGEYKLMGLAPYGNPIYKEKLLKNVIKVDKQGGIELDMKYFGFLESGKMYSESMCQLLFNSKQPPAMVENNLPTNTACDIAASAQEICNLVLAKTSKYVVETTKLRKLALAGGVALNAVSVGYILEQEIVDEVFVQPAASDAGGALGCALEVAARKKVLNRDHVQHDKDAMNNSFLGYTITNEEVEKTLKKYNVQASRKSLDYVNMFVADKVREGNIVAIARGSMEYGARALGNRSILADPRREETQERMNKAVKKRESFRPFAPAILESEIENWCEKPYGSVHMTVTAKLKENKRIMGECVNDSENTYVMKFLNNKRSEVPAVTHVDYSARAQIVKKDNPMHDIIQKFYEKTTIPMVVNTSFNLRGEPIVCTSEDALRCFNSSDIDYLILENYIVTKKDIKDKQISLIEVELD